MKKLKFETRISIENKPLFFWL